jgi:hypothetical protein
VNLAVDRWGSTMGPVNHHAIVYLTDGDRQPPGTLTAASCDFRVAVLSAGGSATDRESPRKYAFRGLSCVRESAETR